MVLILEVAAPQAAQLGTASRKTFRAAGGVIGRDKRSDWVLPHTKVSGHHARITCVNSVFFIEDASRNGTFLNSARNRLAPGRPHPLQSGDRLLIDPYEIDVSVSTDADVPGIPPPQRSYPPSSPPQAGFEPRPFDDDDPFDPFSSPPPVSKPLPRLDAIADALPGEELDPLKLLDPSPKRPTLPKAVISPRATIRRSTRCARPRPTADEQLPRLKRGIARRPESPRSGSGTMPFSAITSKCRRSTPTG